VATPQQRRAEHLNVTWRTQQRSNAPLLGQDVFRSALLRERKRADRSNQPLAVIAVSMPGGRDSDAAPVWRAVAGALTDVKRDTDVLGWFETGVTLGVLFPEVCTDPAFAGELHARVHRELQRRLGPDTADRLSIQLHIHAEEGAAPVEGVRPFDPVLTHVCGAHVQQRRYDAAKRALDLVISLTLLAILAPVFLVVALLVKLSSPGPVFFRQERVGQKMKRFRMLKFRTMRTDTDETLHYQFVSSFIRSGANADAASPSGFFKIADDPRVTSLGRILRRTSLDELPQLWNVVRGEMSLVGPRPPLAYEVEQYQSWHRRRVLEAKPGLTGLWQVTGRSRTTFDEMVRLDLRYARSYSVWTDMKILLATPRAVLSGKGAC
jgi:lipopolysaccharide/colanic/teichoic acid biosynthesis glycosyltransferase